MEVESGLNDSLVLRRRSTRRGRSVTLDTSGVGSSIKKEGGGEGRHGGRGRGSGRSSSDDGDVEEEHKTRSSAARVARLRGKKKLKKASTLVKHSQLGKHRMILRHEPEAFTKRRNVREKPLRRSKREKRLLFTTFNVSKIDKQILNSNNEFQELDLSEEEMDPYEKLLSPHRVTRKSSRIRSNQLSSVASGSGSKMPKVSPRGVKEEGEEGGEGDEEGDDEEEEEDDEDSKEKSPEGEGESEEPTEEDEDEEEVGGYYNLRKRQPVIYSFQPVHHVVEDDTPPKKRRGRRSQSHSTYHTRARAAAPRAYQSNKRSRGAGSSPRKRQAHHDSSSSSTSSDSDSDEARFRRRKSRSMAKARSQCLPMNFTQDDLSQGVIRDRIRIGASLADVNPMNVDRSVTFESIGGLKNHIRALKEMIIFPLLYPEVFDRFQISPPRGVLFHGPPGCGKTLVARALANECSKGGKKVAFFMRKGADCLSKWVGESERQLRLLFDQAYQVRPSIIFFDEIDGLAPVRSSRQDQIHSSIVSTLLALMDGLDSRGEIVVIGATNRIDAIDPALRRPGRFDREFIFPLPSRQDRHSILSIHTKGWNPKLKDRFLWELADHTVGYCGADLRALCTEAALFALRRRYPQIYKASDKLVLDITKINVSAADFYNALKSIVPTAQRSDSSVALALPEHVRPLFLDSLERLLHLLCFVFPPTWKLVQKACVGLEALTAADRATIGRMESKISELRENLSLNRGKAAATTATVRAAEKVPALGRGGNFASNQGPSISSWSGGTFALSNVGNNAIPNDSNSYNGRQGRKRSKSNSPPHAAKRPCLPMSQNGESSFSNSSTTSSCYHQLFLKHSQSAELGKVFFDLTEISSHDHIPSDSPNHTPTHQRHSHSHATSILEEEGVASKSDSSPPTSSTKLQSTCYLNFSSHPHVPPSVHHPRLLLCGQPNMGQSSYLGPALLHALEDLPVRTMDLAMLFGSSTRSPEEACSQTFRELMRVTPSILFLPRLDTWWGVTSETFQMTLLSSLTSLLPSMPLLVLATAECQWEELPSQLKEVFPDAGSQFFHVAPPTLDQRKLFFFEILLEKPFLPPPPTPKPLSDIPLEELPVASPPRPRELNKPELTRVLKQREAVLRELRVFLRDATNKLLAERKFKEFTKPVDPEEVPDYHDIISEPMDLGTIMKKIDENRYTMPKQWIADVELISRNALEYNPEHGTENRLLRHRAVALQDMAHSFLDHELSEDFEKQCEDIAESYDRIEKTQGDPVKLVAGSNSSMGGAGGNASSTPQKDGNNQSCSGALKAELYDAPRRSLRQKGLGPEEKGFPYYSPSKPRTPHKGNKGGGGSGGGGETSDTGDALESFVAGEEEEMEEGEGENATPSLYLLCQDDTPAIGTQQEHDHRSRLTNANVRRQIIRPWEDNKGNGNNNGSERRNGMTTRSTPPLGKGRTNSVQTAAEALVAMATPAKEEDPLVHGHDDDVTVSSDDSDAGYQLAPQHPSTSTARRRRSGTNGRGENQDDIIVCNGRGRRSKSGTPPRAGGETQGKVCVDGEGLVRVFEDIVKGTEGCSIVEMERIHTTYQQLVFRHRMSWQRDGLLEDLRLTTDLFLQELGR